MNNEIIIDGVVYVKKEDKQCHIIPAQKIEWGKVCEKKLNWKDAKEWCEKQGDGWRLPTAIELMNAHEDKIDGFGTAYYWSASENSSPDARFVSFSDGYVDLNGKFDSYSVRCVRNN